MRDMGCHCGRSCTPVLISVCTFALCIAFFSLTTFWSSRCEDTGLQQRHQKKQRERQKAEPVRSEYGMNCAILEFCQVSAGATVLGSTTRYIYAGHRSWAWRQNGLPSLLGVFPAPMMVRLWTTSPLGSSTVTCIPARLCVCYDAQTIMDLIYAPGVV